MVSCAKNQKNMNYGLPWWYGQNLLANAGDMGSISDLGRSHILQSNCPCATTTEVCML